MTNREAIQVLDQATARLPLNRDGHIMVANAVQTIQALVDKHDPLPPEPAAKNVDPNEGGKKKK